MICGHVTNNNEPDSEAMTDEPQATTNGSRTFDDPARNERGIRRTVMALVILSGAILVLGLGSGIVNRERRNEQILPRLLTLYAVYPDLSLQYTQYASPADPQLADDDEPPAEEEQVIISPPLTPDSIILQQDVIGFRPERLTLLDTNETDADIPDANLLEYTLLRQTGDGPYGIELEIEGSPLVSETAIVINTQQDVRFAQTMVAVAIPVTAQNIDSRGFASYRSERIGTWQVFYYDMSLIASPEPITVTYNMADATVPPSLDILQVDQNR